MEFGINSHQPRQIIQNLRRRDDVLVRHRFPNLLAQARKRALVRQQMVDCELHGARRWPGAGEEELGTLVRHTSDGLLRQRKVTLLDGLEYGRRPFRASFSARRFLLADGTDGILGGEFFGAFVYALLIGRGSA